MKSLVLAITLFSMSAMAEKGPTPHCQWNQNTPSPWPKYKIEKIVRCPEGKVLFSLSVFATSTAEGEKYDADELKEEACKSAEALANTFKSLYPKEAQECEANKGKIVIEQGAASILNLKFDTDTSPSPSAIASCEYKISCEVPFEMMVPPPAPIEPPPAFPPSRSDREPSVNPKR